MVPFTSIAEAVSPATRLIACAPERASPEARLTPSAIVATARFCSSTEAATLVGKRLKVRVERVLDGRAYAVLTRKAKESPAPLTAEGEAEKPTRKPPALSGLAVTLWLLAAVLVQYVVLCEALLRAGRG